MCLMDTKKRNEYESTVWSKKKTNESIFCAIKKLNECCNEYKIQIWNGRFWRRDLTPSLWIIIRKIWTSESKSTMDFIKFKLKLLNWMKKKRWKLTNFIFSSSEINKNQQPSHIYFFNGEVITFFLCNRLNQTGQFSWYFYLNWKTHTKFIDILYIMIKIKMTKWSEFCEKKNLWTKCFKLDTW